MEQEKTQKPVRYWIVVLVIAIVLIILFGGYFGLAWILRTANNSISPANTSTSNTSSKSARTKLSDQNLVGTWESDCLVPDQNSKWAEKHKFVINADATAIHTRQDWEMTDCTTLTPAGTITDQYNITVPSSGKINFTYTDNSNTRMNTNQLGEIREKYIYDIYQVSGSTLLFGHGFRGDNLAYGSKTGGSESDRIDSLNNYIIYHKK